MPHRLLQITSRLGVEYRQPAVCRQQAGQHHWLRKSERRLCGMEDGCVPKPRVTVTGARAGPMPIRLHPDWPTNLTLARLVSACLTNAELMRASLVRADLTGADLSGADLTGASLCEAVLLGADLRQARMEGADLTGCTGLAGGPDSAAA